MEWKFPQIWIGNIRHCIHLEDLCSWYKAFNDLFCAMLVVKPWQESIPVPQREAQPPSQFRLSQHSYEHQNGGPCGQQPVAAKGGQSFAVYQQNPRGSKVIFWFAGDAPSIATKTAKSWRITKAMVVCDLAGQMSDMQHIHPFEGWWLRVGISPKLLDRIGCLPSQNTEKIWAKAPSAFPLPQQIFTQAFPKPPSPGIRPQVHVEMPKARTDDGVLRGVCGIKLCELNSENNMTHLHS